MPGWHLHWQMRGQSRLHHQLLRLLRIVLELDLLELSSLLLLHHRRRMPLLLLLSKYGFLQLVQLANLILDLSFDAHLASKLLL